MINSHSQPLIKNSIVIITYNQENLIGRAIESVLCQHDSIFEIIICDDCSTDKTWDVVLGYQQKYPTLIKAFRNSVNLGIFGNIEGSWCKVTGNVMWLLAGDDAFHLGIFEEANKLIQENELDVESDKFSLIFDWEYRNLSGKSRIYRNNLITQHNALSLKLRNLIYNRSLGVSRKVFENFFPVRKDLGIYSDGLIDIQAQMFTDNFFYSPFVGSIYFGDLGIGSKSSLHESRRSYMLVIDEYLKLLTSLKDEDIKWLLFLRSRFQFLLKPDFGSAKLLIHSFFNSLTVTYGLRFVHYQIKLFVKTFFGK